MSRYRLSPRAKSDLRAIAAWYRKHRGPQSARTTLSDIRATLRQLASEPGMGHTLEFVAPPDHLFWPIVNSGLPTSATRVRLKS